MPETLPPELHSLLFTLHSLLQSHHSPLRIRPAQQALAIQQAAGSDDHQLPSRCPKAQKNAEKRQKSGQPLGSENWCLTGVGSATCIAATKTSSRTPNPPGAQKARNPAHHAKQCTPTTHHLVNCRPNGPVVMIQIAMLCQSRPSVADQ